MEDKIINIPFNRTNFEDSQRLVWEIASKKTKSTYIGVAVISASMVCLGFELPHEAMPAVTITGGIILALTLIFWSGFAEKKAKHYKLIHQQANQFEDEQMACTYLFSDFGIEYTDKEKAYKLSWRLFRSFCVYKQYLIIFLRDNGLAIFTIAKHELGDDDFNDVYEILKNRIREVGKPRRNLN